MTKYLLDYFGGSKGDFLANFINNNEIQLDNKFSKSKSQKINLKLPFDDNTLHEILSKDFMFCAGHKLYNIDSYFLKKYGCKILKLMIEEKFITTVLIEFYIKNQLHPTNIVTEMKIKNINDYHYFQKYKKVKYVIDFDLIENCKELTDENRITELLINLENIPNEFSEKKLLINQLYDTIYKTLSYGDIFINKKYDMLNEIKPSFNSVVYEELLEKTWLPDIVNVFGYDINLRSYGYRDY
jgi:hypothetical protein